MPDPKDPIFECEVCHRRGDKVWLQAHGHSRLENLLNRVLRRMAPLGHPRLKD